MGLEFFREPHQAGSTAIERRSLRYLKAQRITAGKVLCGALGARQVQQIERQET
jgi:hypothetical protein